MLDNVFKYLPLVWGKVYIFINVMEHTLFLNNINMLDYCSYDWAISAHPFYHTDWRLTIENFVIL